MNTSRKRLWITVVVLLVLSALAVTAWRTYTSRQAASQANTAAAKIPTIELTPADVAKAQVMDLNTGLPITGTVKAVQSAVVKARVPGELQGLSVREGDSVQAGQVLARVESSEFADRLRQALQQADAAKAQVDIAQRQYDNNAALVNQGFISRTALDTSLANLNAARASHRAALAGAEVARKSVADTVLRAPINGQISQRLAQPGERVSPEARIVEIVDLSRLEVEAALSPADSVAVRVGQGASLTIEGVGKPVTATVTRINPTAQAGSRSVLVYLALQSQPGLRQGLFAHGQLTTGQSRSLAVPLSAVRTDKPLPYVQAVENGRVAHRTVETSVRGAVDGETVLGIHGISEGALVLRGAAGALPDGTQVRMAAMPAASGASAARAQP